MKKTALCLLSFAFLISFASHAADTNPPPRLTVELRDGSRVVGASLEKHFKFKSALLGEIKLNVKAIRSVECVSSNSAKISTVNGDSLTVSFADSDFAVKTSFGKVNLQVDSVRKISVSAGGAGTHPAGLVALWSGEGDGIDSVGGSSATLTDITFAEGKVGRAFSFNGTSSGAKISASEDLNVGKKSGFTISAWIKPSAVNVERPIVEWNNGGGYGAHFWISTLNYGSGCLYANLVDTEGREHILASPPRIIRANVFQFVAVTYDQDSGVGMLYLNGAVVAHEQLGIFTTQTSYDLYLGTRASGGAQANWWTGALDEVSLYNRALSAEEIKAVCTEENHGEPLPPPSVSQRPFNGIYRSVFGE